MENVWLLSIGFSEEGWYPIGIFSSEEKAIAKAAEEVRSLLHKNPRLAPLMKKLRESELRNEQLIMEYNELVYGNRLIWEEVEIDTDMRRSREV